MKLLLTVAMVLFAHVTKTHSPFSHDFIEHISPLTCAPVQPESIPQSINVASSIIETRPDTAHPFFTKKRAQLCINAAALIYAIIKFCASYHQIYYQNNNEYSWVNGWMPKDFTTLKNRNLLLWHTFLITVETLFFKTIAQCFLACATLNLGSLIWSSDKK